jgi:hypothetical protein
VRTRPSETDDELRERIAAEGKIVLSAAALATLDRRKSEPHAAPHERPQY